MDDSEHVEAISVAQALHTAQIPCVLWGEYLLNVYGVPSIISSIDYVIPDGELQKASLALQAMAALQPCPDQVLCTVSRSTRPTPPPSQHFHLKIEPEISVCIYLQRDTLWFLPPLTKLLLPPQLHISPYYILASDASILPPPYEPGRGSGAFSPDTYPVVVPKSHILLEALMRIYARDAGTTVGQCAMPMICYIELYVDGDGYLDLKQLPEELERLYLELKSGTVPVREWQAKLKQAVSV